MNTIINTENLGITSPKSLINRQKITSVDSNDANPFEPIGIGKPLVIRFHTLHVGELNNGLLNKKQAILVTSVIKDDITYDVPPRGVHQIYTKIRDRQILYPSAANEGTELVYYSKAFDNGKLKFSIEVKADRFNEGIVEDVSNVLGLTSGLPVFAPYAPFILAGSQLIKIGGDIVNKAIDKIPFLSYEFDISENIGGIPNSKSGWLIGGNKEQLSNFKGYEIVYDENAIGNVYLARSAKKYTGDIPYVLLSIDGRSNQRYNNFRATIASASVLKKFYGISETTQVENIQNMINLYNDYTYVKKIKDNEKLIQKTKDEKEKENLNKLLEAYKSNINNEDLRNIVAKNK